MLRRLQFFTTLFLYLLEYSHIIARPACQSTALRFIFSFMKQRPPVGHGHLIIEASR
jgi:hypothetical protein